MEELRLFLWICMYAYLSLHITNLQQQQSSCQNTVVNPSWTRCRLKRLSTRNFYTSANNMRRRLHIFRLSVWPSVACLYCCPSVHQCLFCMPWYPCSLWTDFNETWWEYSFGFAEKVFRDRGRKSRLWPDQSTMLAEAYILTVLCPGVYVLMTVRMTAIHCTVPVLW